MSINGTLVNAGSIIVGSSIGLLVKSNIPERITKVAFQGIGLFTLFLGFYMALKTNNFLIMIFSILIGSIIGGSINIEKFINRFGEKLRSKIKTKDENFSEGLVTAFLLFCMGSMTILGAIEEGLGGFPHLLFAKSILDGFSSIALSSALGIGVMFSAIPLLIYQGGLTLFAGLFQNVLSSPVINEITAVGGLMLIGLGINILDIKKLRVINMLPALIAAGILAYLLL
ncbi:MAG: DUF554 domain-containing protein [candidate division WOR-3 bacterium]|nr:DUF554 domain-containing protein [candidate division WOR-3 bacterium]